MPNPNVGLGAAMTGCTIPANSVTIVQADYNNTAYNGRGSIIQVLLSCSESTDDTGTYVIDECPIEANVIGGCNTFPNDSYNIQIFEQDLNNATKGNYCWCTIARINGLPPNGSKWYGGADLYRSYTSHDACLNGCRDVCIDFIRRYGADNPMLQWALSTVYGN